MYPTTKKEFLNFYGEFKFKNDDKCPGQVVITDGWDKKNIVVLELPILKPTGKKWKINIHAKLVEDVKSIFNEWVGLNVSYPVVELGGWVARRQYWSPVKPLSTHAWGCAIDINWSTNPAGRRDYTLPDNLIGIFETHGWTWGGRWRAKDVMHFQAYKQ